MTTESFSYSDEGQLYGRHPTEHDHDMYRTDSESSAPFADNSADAASAVPLQSEQQGKDLEQMNLEEAYKWLWRQEAASADAREPYNRNW